MDLTHFSPKDRQIINNNPDLTPYDLLQKGLSQKAYDRLIDEKSNEKDSQRTEKEEPIAPYSVEPIKDKPEPHKPKLHEAQRIIGDTKTIVGSTGIPQRMNARLAMDLVNKYPNEFKLIDNE